MILQNIIVLSAAFDLSGDKAFLNAARESMDYVLRAQCHGDVLHHRLRRTWPQNQHSRWYAHQVDDPAQSACWLACRRAEFDAGGCVAKERLQGCAPQTCYVDDIVAYGSNEITINWNAPLVYVASFLADARWARQMTGIAFVGTGFVADYYMTTLANHPQLRLVGVFDIDPRG